MVMEGFSIDIPQPLAQQGPGVGLMEGFGIDIPQPLAQNRSFLTQGAGVTAKPMYAIQLPAANKATMEDDQNKSQMAWRIFAVGWCCVAFSQFLPFLAWGAYCLWPIVIYIFYCQIPASQRSDYTKTKTPAQLSLCSCTVCVCCCLFALAIPPIMTHIVNASMANARAQLNRPPHLQANFALVGEMYCVSHEGLSLRGEPTPADSLADCKGKCADSEQCQAIHWSNRTRGCELLNQAIKTNNPGQTLSPQGVECWKKQIAKSDRVQVVQDVAGQALDRWQQARSKTFPLLKGDLGTVISVERPPSSGFPVNSVGVIFDKDFKQEVWLDRDHLDKGDPPLAEVDDDALIEEVLKNFPSAEDFATLKCPITKQIIIDPVVASDGWTYERSALEEASHKSEVTNFAIKPLLEALTGKAVVGVGAESHPASFYTVFTHPAAEPEASSEEVEESRDQNQLRTGQRPSSQTMLQLAIFTCPISLELFTDPVVASDGQTYEKTQIKTHMRRDPKSPKTREILTSDLFPNLVMKRLLKRLIDKADLIQPTSPVQ